MSERTALYRHWDKAGNLLYVGIFLSALNRLAQHSHASHWFQTIEKVTIEWLDTREAAIAAERAAILSEKPLHNIQGATAARHENTAEARHRFEQEVDRTRERLTRRVVDVAPLYTIPDAAKALGLTRPALARTISGLGLKTVTLPDDKRAPPREYITGWSLITLLEMLDDRAVPTSLAA